MRLLIDTSVDSGFGVPASAESLWAERWLHRVGAIPVSAVTVFERSYGFRRVMGRSDSRALWEERWAAYEEAITEGGFYEVLPWDVRRSWLLDVLIASHAAADGRAVMTSRLLKNPEGLM